MWVVFVVVGAVGAVGRCCVLLLRGVAVCWLMLLLYCDVGWCLCLAMWS